MENFQPADKVIRDHLQSQEDNTHNFSLVTYNPNLRTALLINGKSNKFATTELTVYDLNVDEKAKRFTEDNLYVNVAHTPIAVASMITQKEFANIDQLYVGRTYRRNGIGSMILSIFEDIATDIGYQKLYINKNIQESDDINLVRAFHSDTTRLQNFINTIHRYDTYIGKEHGKTRFLQRNGYHADNDPYNYPFKSDLKNTGYIHDTIGKDIDVARFNAESLTEFLSPFKKEPSIIQKELILDND